jgi:hypothetical protein
VRHLPAFGETDGRRETECIPQRRFEGDPWGDTGEAPTIRYLESLYSKQFYTVSLDTDVSGAGAGG